MKRIESKIDTRSPEFEANREVSEAVSRLAEAAHPSRIILFGSQARGNADDRSDYDFLVVCDAPYDRRRFVASLLRSLNGVGIASDVVVLTPEEYETDKLIPGTIARPAWLEGKVLYESD